MEQEWTVMMKMPMRLPSDPRDSVPYLKGYNDAKLDYEVQHGRWEWIGGYGYQYRCSECIRCVEHRTKYCPHCGAKMDKVSE